MNSFELNKILGAVLGTCLILLALNIGAGALFAPEKPAKPGFDIAVKQESGEKAGAAKEPEQPIEVLRFGSHRRRLRGLQPAPSFRYRRDDRSHCGAGQGRRCNGDGQSRKPLH